MENNIAIYNTKGGVGKTSLSYSLSKDLKLNYITNDISVSIMKLSKAKLIKKNIPLCENTLYDFGGFEDIDALNISNLAKLVIIPTIADMNSLARTISLIKKLNHSRIIVIATMIETEKDFEDIQTVINHHFKDIEVLQFRKTKLLKNSMKLGISPLELYKQKRLYQNAIVEYKNIINKCKKEI